MGGSLLEINCQDEQDTITHHLRADQKLKKYTHWIGLNDKGNEGEWVWDTSHTLLNEHYHNWDKDQPDNYFWREHCAHMKKVGKDIQLYPLKWNDDNYNRKSNAICEKGDYRFHYHISFAQNYPTLQEITLQQG